MRLSEREDKERERPREYNEERETVRVRANLEARDAHTIYVRLLEPSVAERTGDFSEQIEAGKVQLEQSRTQYVNAYATVLEARRNSESGAAIERFMEAQKRAHREYVSAKKRYAEVLVEAQKTRLVNSGVSPEEKKMQLDSYIRTEIFNTLVVNEEAVLQEQKSAAHPAEAKGILRRMYERWDGLSGIQKGLIMTALATGTAFVSTGLARGFGSIEMTAVALLFSKSFLIGLTQEFVAGFTALGINTVLGKKIEQQFTEGVEKERQRTRIHALESTSQRYKGLLEKKSLQGSQALVVSALAMLATGRAFNLGLNFLSQTSALKDVTDAVATSFQNGPDIVGKLSDTDALGKPTKGLFKTIVNYFND